MTSTLLKISQEAWCTHVNQFNVVTKMSKTLKVSQKAKETTEKQIKLQIAQTRLVHTRDPIQNGVSKVAQEAWSQT